MFVLAGYMYSLGDVIFSLSSYPDWAEQCIVPSAAATKQCRFCFLLGTALVDSVETAVSMTLFDVRFFCNRFALRQSPQLVPPFPRSGQPRPPRNCNFHRFPEETAISPACWILNRTLSHKLFSSCRHICHYGLLRVSFDVLGMTYTLPIQLKMKGRT